MTGARRVTANAAFALVFVLGAVLVWIGVRAFVFGHGGVGRGTLALATGFAVWALLMVAARPATPGQDDR